MRSALIVAALSVAGVLVGCDTQGCAATTMRATDAGKVDLGAPLGSAVLTASLTSGGKPVQGVPVSVTLLVGDSSGYQTSADTTTSGRVSVDLKGKLSATSLVGLVRADHWQASFAGTAQYCSSADEATFSLTR